jgi:hypothetical protein
MEAIQQYISSNQYLAFTILLAIMVLGEVVSRATKGRIPSALIMMIVLIAGFWTILPPTLADDSGISSGLYKLTVVLIITHLGSLINRKQMAEQWRTVVVCLMGIAAICLFTLVIGGPIFGKANAVAAAPVLTGAAIAATIMSEAAKAAGNQQAQLVALVTMVVQSLFGFPLTAMCLRKETARLSGLYGEGKLAVSSGAAAQAIGPDGNPMATKKEKFISVNLILLKLSLLCLVGYLLQKLTKGYVSIYVWCLLLGFGANELGFLESDALGKAKSDGILMTFLLGYLFCSFSFATPQMLLPVLGITLGLAAISTVGLTAVAWISSKIFKKSETFWSCYAMVLNAYLGFPLNVMLVNEALDTVKEPKERAAISGELMPKMLVAGFVCVTIVSVLVAGIMKNFL